MILGRFFDVVQHRPGLELGGTFEITILLYSLILFLSLGALLLTCEKGDIRWQRLRTCVGPTLAANGESDKFSDTLREF